MLFDLHTGVNVVTMVDSLIENAHGNSAQPLSNNGCDTHSMGLYSEGGSRGTKEINIESWKCAGML